MWLPQQERNHFSRNVLCLPIKLLPVAYRSLPSVTLSGANAARRGSDSGAHSRFEWAVGLVFRAPEGSRCSENNCGKRLLRVGLSLAHCQKIFCPRTNKLSLDSIKQLWGDYLDGEWASNGRVDYIY